MSEEQLQSDGQAASEFQVETNFDVDQNSPADPQTGSDLAPEQTNETETQESSGFQEAINKQHKKYRDEERLRIAAEHRAADSDRQLQEMQATQNAPSDIPEMPDQFDENYEQKLAERDRIVREQATFDAQKQYAQNQQHAAQQAAQQQRTQRINDQFQGYNKRANDLGINTQELQAAGNIVGSAGISEDMQVAIINDPDGPLITKFLAANPLEIDAIRNMDPYSAAMHIERNVRSKAVALKPKLSNANAPPTAINGGGADPDRSKFPMTGGATFE